MPARNEDIRAEPSRTEYILNEPATTFIYSNFFTNYFLINIHFLIWNKLAFCYIFDTTVSVVSIKKQLKNKINKKKTVFFKLDISKTKWNLEKWYSSFSSYFGEYYKNPSSNHGAAVTVELPKSISIFHILLQLRLEMTSPLYP